MKKLRSIIALLMATVMLTLPLGAFVSASESAADSVIDYMLEKDIEMICAFLEQVDENGVSNGDKALEYTRRITGWTPEWYDPENPYPAMRHYFEIYNGTWQPGPSLIHNIRFCFFEPYQLFFVHPEFHGIFDMSETSTFQFNGGGSTRITQILFNDCPNLNVLSLNNPCCETISALNCPNLTWVSTENCNSVKNLALEPAGYDEPVKATVFGEGRMTVDIRPEIFDGYRLTAKGRLGSFLGWFKNGERVCETSMYVGAAGEGCDLVACFLGDANGDDNVTVADAVLTMRTAMGLVESDAAAQADAVDTNSNGVVDTADALTIMRFVMGLWFSQ